MIFPYFLLLALLLSACDPGKTASPVGLTEPTTQEPTETTEPAELGEITEPVEPAEDSTAASLDTGSGSTTGCQAPELGHESSAETRLITTDALPIQVSLLLSDSGYQNTLTLDAPEGLALMEAWSAPLGTAVALGPYSPGTELVFGIDVQNTGDHWQSGPSVRNADGVAHVTVTYEGDCSWLIGFEDLYGGGDFDYNDVVFRVQGLLIEQ